METDYQARKNEVLASYETVEELVQALKTNAEKINMPDPLEQANSLLTDIRCKAGRVRADRFKIMIAGEAKSGKSTFINAYLGIELLPMDVEQCTSSIIEIKYGPELCVHATYADKPSETIKGDEAVKEFLKKNAALDDEFRDIPVPTINHEILIKSGLRAREKGAKIKILATEVDDLLKAPEVQAANIHNIPVDEYNEKIRSYIRSHKDHWQDIVTKIVVFYPFGENMRGIEIVDSPGVCARGGVAEITAKYIEKADAIIFLKPLTGQALVATQFHHFMRSASVERNKNALFLVLTRAADLLPDDLRRLKESAYSTFSNLPQDHILLVDSKAELYVKRLEPIRDIEAELRRMNRDETLDAFVLSAYVNTKGFFSDGEKVDFIGALQEKSRFSQVYNALEVFGRKAHYILLGELLGSICKLYSKLESDLSLQMDMYRQKAENPIELAKKIAKIKEDLEDIQDKLAKGVDEVSQRFRGDDGIVLSTARAATLDYVSKVEQIDPKSDGAFDELKRLSIQKVDEFNTLMTALQEQVVSEFDRELVKFSDKCPIAFESLQPNFTADTFDELRKRLKSLAETKEPDTFLTFKSARTHSVYSQHRHFQLVKDSIMERLTTIKNDLTSTAFRFISDIRSKYIQELSNNADAKKKELDSVYAAKATAEQIAEIIRGLEQLSQQIKTAKAVAVKLKGGIEKNVQ